MKKILALVLAFAMVFSSIPVVFADTEVSAEAKALALLGMLEGDGNGVTVEYTAKELTRLGAAAALLKLKGLYDEAIAFQGEDNFADVKDYAWVEGRNLMAYLKANPGLGFGGDEKGNFNPGAMINEQSYYKVLLETLGYKQTTAEVAGDFAWEEVFDFAEKVGLKPAKAEKFTIDELAKATFAALNAKTKDGKVYVDTLIAAGVVTEELAVAAGVKEEAPVVTAALDSAVALGNTVVEVTFDSEINEGAADASLYTIEGLGVEDAVVTGEKTVRLTTAAMTGGKVYTLTFGDTKVKFTGVAKKTGAPDLTKAVSEDIEEVVLTFDKNLDFATATDVANYTISGVEIVSAEVDGAEVTLTTEGLAARKQYTVKVTNIKSVDGGLLKSDSATFYTRPDTSAPTVESVEAETNTRVIVTFNEKVTKESAENIANYVIKQDSTELAVLEAKLVASGTYKEKQVELTTEPQAKNKKYTITISNITDITKAANTMTKEVTKTFYGKIEDTVKPVFASAEAIARNLIKVKFTDTMSRLDESTVLDPNNYTLKKGTEEFAIVNIEKLSSKTGEFEALLTVEELNVGNYSLKAENVADEFGNAISATSKTVVVNRDVSASAKLTKITFKDSDTIILTFNKALNEESAEDIANYTIDGDIGSPVSATYDSDAYTVELDTAEFIKNEEYKLTIDGLLDLAGNELYYKEVKFSALDGYVDDEEPELLDVYALNKYVVALAFNEEITTYENSVLKLREKGTSTNVTLVASALSEDGTVVEYSAYSTQFLAADKEYEVVSVVYGVYTGIKDFAGNEFKAPSSLLDDFVVSGTSELPQRLEVLNITQINGTTFELTMSGNVVTKTAPSGWSFGDDDGDEVIRLIKSTKILESDEKYVLDLSSFLSDEHGIPVRDIDEDNDMWATGFTDKSTNLYVEFEDKEKPYIVNVVALDRETVEIEYSERVNKVTGSFQIFNTDESVSKANIAGTVTATTTNVGSTKVKISLTSPLEARYDYKLVVYTAVVKDLVGLSAEEKSTDTFYFNGTDLAKLGTVTVDQVTP